MKGSNTYIPRPSISRLELTEPVRRADESMKEESQEQSVNLEM